MDLGPGLNANIKRCKYDKPTPVQKYSIPICLQGRDLMACAQTGSGKTAAFCFPIIANITLSNFQPSGRQRKAYPLALILSPTRELSSQIYEEAKKFSFQTGIRPVVVYGGAPVVNQVGASDQFAELQCSSAPAARALRVRCVTCGGVNGYKRCIVTSTPI